MHFFSLATPFIDVGHSVTDGSERFHRYLGRFHSGSRPYM